MHINLTHDDLQRICYHLQRAEKENKLTDKDMGTLLKAAQWCLCMKKKKINAENPMGILVGVIADD